MYAIRKDRALSVLAVVFAFGLLWCSVSQAQLQPTTNVVVTDSLNSDGNINANAARLRRPTTDALGKAHVGIFVMHSFAGYQNFSVCNGLAQRGFTTLCADSIWTGRQDQFYGFEQHAPGIRAGINYLRNLPADPMTGLPAISKVILWGHSAGSAMMSFYQNVAENGPRIACQGREKILPCVDTNLRNLPKADGLMLFDPQEGPDVWFFNVDPAVINNSCTVRDPRVDMFLPENGLTSNESGTYSKQFLKRFFKEQAERNRDLLEVAQDLLRAKRLVTGNPNEMGDDIPFTIVGTTDARPWNYDLNLRRITKKPHIFLSRDGMNKFQIVETVRVPNGDAESGLDCTASTVTVNVHIWLGAKALRTTDQDKDGKGHKKGKDHRNKHDEVYNQTENDILGVDWDSSATNPVTNLKGVGKHPNGNQKTTPLLIISNGAYYFIVPGEIYYNVAYSKDKTYAISEGAVHGGGPCADCTRVILNNPDLPTAEANAYWTDPQGNGPLERSFNFMAEWLSARY
jgi:hypothetical protein